MKKSQLRNIVRESIRGLMTEQSQVYYYPELTICYVSPNPPTWLPYDHNDIGQIWSFASNQYFEAHLDGTPFQPSDVGKIVELSFSSWPGLVHLEITNVFQYNIISFNQINNHTSVPQCGIGSVTSNTGHTSTICQEPVNGCPSGTLWNGHPHCICLAQNTNPGGTLTDPVSADLGHTVLSNPCIDFTAMPQNYQDGCCIKCEDPNLTPSHQCYEYCDCCPAKKSSGKALKERLKKLANIKKK